MIIFGKAGAVTGSRQIRINRCDFLRIHGVMYLCAFPIPPIRLNISRVEFPRSLFSLIKACLARNKCLSCGQKEMVYAVRVVPYSYKGHETVISKVKGWHCSHCGEVEFDPGVRLC